MGSWGAIAGAASKAASDFAKKSYGSQQSQSGDGKSAKSSTDTQKAADSALGELAKGAVKKLKPKYQIGKSSGKSE